jgi:molybdopterin molybdotransferase
MVSLEAARAIVAECVRPLPVEEIPLSDATGRTIAEPVFNDADAPRFDRSAMDGYALRAADVPTGGASLRLIGQIGAGADFAGDVQPGTCVQINTGAPLPDGADTVVRIEDTQVVEDGAVVKINTAPQAGRHIVRRGTYGRAGDEVIPAGTCLRAEQIAIAATVGAARLRAYRRPRFAVLATGDELVAADVVPTGARIRDSNGPMLLSLLAEDGVECAGLGRVGDDRARLTAAIERGLAGDGLCLSGGISMGAFDYVPEVLAACGVRIRFRKMATKPGKPTLFGTTEQGGCVFALPGNPISALIGYRLLVRPTLALMRGQGSLRSPFRAAVLRGSFPATKGRRAFWPATLAIDPDGRLTATPQPWHGSGDVLGMGISQGFITRPAGAAAVAEGASVAVLITRGEDLG